MKKYDSMVKMLVKNLCFVRVMKRSSKREQGGCFLNCEQISFTDCIISVHHPQARLDAAVLFRDRISSTIGVSGNSIASGHDSQLEIGAKRAALREVGNGYLSKQIEATCNMPIIFRLKESD
jgi:hypothetical protein